MKKIISSILLVVLMLSLVLGAMTGCGKKNKTAADFVMPEGGFDTTKEVEIVFYHQMGSALEGILNTAIED